MRYMLDTEDYGQPDSEHRCDSVQGSSGDYIVCSFNSSASDCSSSSTIDSEDTVRSSKEPLMPTCSNGE